MFWILSGNGTLNKQAGIDYKQLSLLAKINENQSGEVSCALLLPSHLERFFFQASQSFNWRAVLYTAVAGSMARRRDHSEGAAGERLDHQEEQRLQRGAPETQVIHTHQFFNNNNKSFAVFAHYKFYKPPFSSESICSKAIIGQKWEETLCRPM